MALEIVFATYSLSEDNDRGIATGWNGGRLSARGRDLVRELGARRAVDRISVVFASDLERAVETASLAFEGMGVRILLD